MAGFQPFSCSIFLLTHNTLDLALLEHYGFSVNDSFNRVKLKQLPQSVETLVDRAAARYSVFRELKRGHIHFYSAVGEPRDPEWSSEVQIPAPHISIFGIVQNVLAVTAAVVAVIMINRPKKKSANE
jgi:hypothetical protein